MTKNKARAGKRRARKCIAALVLVFCMGAAAYMGYMAVTELMDRHEGTDYYAELARTAEQTAAPVTTAAAPGETAGEMEKTAAAQSPEATFAAQETIGAEPEETAAGSEIDFDGLWATCPDVVGWIRIEDTAIDYPVVQGVNNQYYLSHLPNGAENDGGSIMMDIASEGDFSSMVTILHGHHMRSGAMFGDLDEYADPEYFAAHPYLRLMTPAGDFDVAIFAGYHVDGNTYGYDTGYATEAEFMAFVDEAVRLSGFEADVEVEFGDRLIMLSTCAYVSEDARFVVLGKIIE